MHFMEWLIKWLENRRIEAGLKQYAVFKAQNPQVEEEGLCRMLLVARILSTRATELGLKNVGDAEYALKKLGADCSSVEGTLAWVIMSEDPGRYSVLGSNPLRQSGSIGYWGRVEATRKEKEVLIERIRNLKKEIYKRGI